MARGLTPQRQSAMCKYRMTMNSERVPIKVHNACHCDGLFRSNLPDFIKGFLVTVMLFYAYFMF
jgi:hypothetical protein